MMTTPTIEVASLGMWDSLILMVMALVVFGPRRLPEIGRQIGKLMYEVRKASNDFKFQMEDELRKAEEADRRKKEEALAAPAVVDSQLSEARAGVPESPFPGESVYPAVSPAEFQHEEPYPQIHPPLTGEPVQAERPGRMMEQGAEPVPELAAKKAARVTKKQATDQATAPVKKSRKKPESTNG
jgi:sec-independent protein translocase protein TatB